MYNMLNYIKLNKGEIWRPKTAPKGAKPKVLSGQAWVTSRGCPKDYILNEGESFPNCDEDWVVESLSQELTIELPPAYSPLLS